MSQELTHRQREILNFICERIATEGNSPTRVEIAQAFGFASPNAAESHLRAIAKKGFIHLESGTARSIRVNHEVLQMGLGTSLPLVGRVAAGSPILAQEHIERQYPVDPKMFRPRADFLLMVRGLSMMNAGILEGDLLAVHRSAEARDGQIVVARVDDDVTVKRLQRQPGGLISLLPENPDFKPIVVDPRVSSINIEGIAVGLIRNGFAHS